MKIKNIKIEAFRLFKNEDVYLTSRKNSDKASNFVAVYAPNGFGKTSFFDAMEFCMTNRIQRVTHENFDENFKIDQAQNGLTFIHNNDLPEENIRIEINFEGNKSEIITCEPNEERELLTGKVKNSYFQNAILSQDWFSEFLSTKSSTDRFKIFMGYFAETNDQLNYHEIIGKSITSIGRHIGKLSKDIKDKERIIDKSIDNSIILKIAEAAEVLKQWHLHVSWQNIVNGKTLKILQLEAENLLSNIMRVIESCSLLSNNLNKIIFESDGLINIERLAVYKQDINKKGELSQSLQERLLKINHLKSNMVLETNSKKTLDEANKSLANIDYLLSHYNVYMSLQHQLVQNNLLLKQTQASRDALLIVRAEKTAQQQSLNDQFLLADTRKEDFAKKAERLHEKYVAYEALISEQQMKKSSEAELTEKRNQLDLTLYDLQNKATKLEKQKNSLLQGMVELVEGVFEDETKNIINAQMQLRQWNADLEKLKHSIKEKNDFNSDLQKLIASSRNLLSELKNGVCPLCGHDYVDQEALLNSISQNTTVAHAIRQDVQYKEKLIKTINEQELWISENYATLKEKVDNEIVIIKSQIDDIKKKIEVVILQKQALVARFSSIIETITIQYSDFTEKTEKEVKKNIDKNIESEDLKLVDLNKQRQSLIVEVGKIDTELEQYIQKIEILHKKIATTEFNPQYFEYRTYAGIDNVTEQDYEKWTRQKEEYNQSIIQLKEYIKSLSLQIAQLQQDGIKTEEETVLVERRISLQEDLNVLNSSFLATLAFMKNNCQISINDSNVDIDMLKVEFYQRIKENSDSLKSNQECQNALRNYLTLLLLGVKYNENENHKKELEKLKITRQQYISDKELLNT